MTVVEVVDIIRKLLWHSYASLLLMWRKTENSMNIVLSVVVYSMIPVGVVIPWESVFGC